MADITTLQKQVVAFRDARNWKKYHTPKGLVLGLLVELGELAEHVQYLDGKELSDYIESHRAEIGDEIIDVLYWLLIAADEFEIDLSRAFKNKMKKNALKYPVSQNGKEVGKLIHKLEREEAEKTKK